MVGARDAASSDRRPGLWRQAVVLGSALILVAVAVAGPVRGYLDRRAELSQAIEQDRRLEAEVAVLEQRKAALQDPDYVLAEARRRLQYVSPDETVYRVIGPAASGEVADPEQPAPAPTPWYGRLWETIDQDAPAGG